MKTVWNKSVRYTSIYFFSPTYYPFLDAGFPFLMPGKLKWITYAIWNKITNNKTTWH